MAKTQYIVATFKDGTSIDRTTTNKDLAFGWRAFGRYEHGAAKLNSNKGFSRTRQLAEASARAYNKYWKYDFHFEVVPVVVHAKKPKKSTLNEKTGDPLPF